MLTSCARRLRRTRAGGDAGVTLMELVVSMTLMTIIGSMAMTFFVGMNTATSKTTSVNQSTAGARTVLDSWTALLRVADSTVAPGSASGRILMVTPTEITFYADVNNRTCSSTCSAVSNPTKIDLSLAGGQLVEKRYTYSSGAYPSTPTTTDVLASGASASGWLFTPYVNGNPPTFTAQNLCPGGSSRVRAPERPAPMRSRHHRAYRHRVLDPAHDQRRTAVVRGLRRTPGGDLMSRLQRMRADGEEGFALLFVLMVTTVIMLGVTTALVVTANNVIPARHSQDTTVATAAAEAGLQRYVAYLNAKCITFDSAACSNINGTPYSATVSGADSAGTATFTRQVLNPSTYLSDGFLRVKSTGFFSGGSRTLTADLIGKPNPLRFTSMSGYEAQGSAFLNSYYPARSIKVTTAAAVAAANNTTAVLSPGSVVTWNSPSSAPNGWDDSICDRLYYDLPGVPGRYTIKSTLRATMPIGADWAESGNDGTLYQPCETTFTTGMTFNGPMYTLDAPYLSYGLGGTVGTNGPVFKTPAAETYPPVSTGWAKTAAPGWSATPYHSFPFIGGDPSSLSSTPNGPNSTIQNLTWSLTLPVNADQAKAGATCIYTGPTRITVSGATATIVSPLTATSAGACYTNTDATITGTGITSAQVPVATTSIYVANAGDVTNPRPPRPRARSSASPTAWPTPRRPPRRRLRSGRLSGPPTPRAGQRSRRCRRTRRTSSASSPPPHRAAPRRPGPGSRRKAAALLTAFTPTASLTTDLKTVVDNTFAYYNTPWTNAAGAPTTGTLGQYRYVVTPSASDTTVTPATGCPVAPGTTTGLTNASLAAPTSDALLGQRTNGTESQTVTCAETQATSTVARQLYGCYVNASGFLDATTTNAGTCSGVETAKWSGGQIASAATLGRAVLGDRQPLRAEHDVRGDRPGHEFLPGQRRHHAVQDLGRGQHRRARRRVHRGHRRSPAASASSPRTTSS